MQAVDLDSSVWGSIAFDKALNPFPGLFIACFRSQASRQSCPNEAAWVVRLGVNKPAVLFANKQSDYFTSANLC